MKNVALALALLGSCAAASATQGTLTGSSNTPNGTLCTYRGYTQEGAITGSKLYRTRASDARTKHLHRNIFA